MVIGHDIDGRPISYDETSHALAIGSMPVTLEHLERYNSRGNVHWVSDGFRAWFAEWVWRSRVELARQAEPVAVVDTYPARAQASAAADDPKFEQALRRGKEGEAQVSHVLRAHKSDGPWLVLDDLLLRVGNITAQVDHVVVDGAGVVLVETKVRNKALIRGRSSDPKWTACYSRGRHPTFENPLQQNRGHESLLLQLAAKGRLQLRADAVDSLIVFVGSNVDNLELRSEDENKVVSLEQLPGWLERRSELAASFAVFDADRAERIRDWLRSSDASTDPDAQRLHEKYRRR